MSQCWSCSVGVSSDREFCAKCEESLRFEREARRPQPVSTLLSARQDTIHRDPGAARAARSVKVSDPLPPEVLKLLGDDATPERAAEMFSERVTSNCNAGMDDESDSTRRVLCELAWEYALAAASIRAREATIARENCREGFDSLHDLIQAELKAIAAYDALRNWRKP